MAKNYTAFIDELREAIIRETGLPQERIYFEAKGSKRTQKGDRLFIECAVTENTKEVCGLFTRDLYRSYQERHDVQIIAEEVARELDKVRQIGFFDDTRKLESYEAAKDSLMIRLMNLDRNRDDLQNAIYRTVGDIALVLYLQLGSYDGCVTSVKIRKNHACSWGMNEDDLFEQGLHNVGKLDEPRVFLWEKLMADYDYHGESFLEDVLSMGKTDLDMMRSPMGACLSTRSRINGAVSIFIPGVAERIGKLMGSDFYLVFTSIHEVMIHGVDQVDAMELKTILRDTIREATAEEEFLTYHIYYYDKEYDKFSCVL